MISGSDCIDDRFLHAAISIAGEAARRIMEIYRTGFSVRHKPDHSPVTEADLASDKLIVEALGSLRPQYPVISEETECPPFTERARWKRYWLVDPLDGTHGFVRRSGEFTVNVALIDEHRPIAGVVYAPADGVCYFARAGTGAYRRNANGEVVPISTSERKRGPIRVITSPSRRNPLTRGFIEALGDVEVERLGSALKSCRIAEGRADVYPGFSRTSEWDTAAAQCVVEEAGGRLMDLRGRPLRYNLGPELDNPKFLAVGDQRRDWRRVIPRG
ncbi:MAG TPA: 3'(2'),5'-bisphosphate nucleotidase CysQ [Gammaproteobacteria bacterium]